MKLSKRVGLFNDQTATGNDFPELGPPFEKLISVYPLVPSKILRSPNFFFQHLTRPQGTI